MRVAQPPSDSDLVQHSRAIDILLACCRAFLGSQPPQGMVPLLQGDLDWEKLLRAAQRHGLTPILERQLLTASPTVVPADVRGRLREEVELVARQNLLLAAELAKIVGLFTAHRIAVMPYKGPVLGATLYGNLALRPCVDLDLLLPSSDVRRARELLLTLGYEEKFQLSPAEEHAYLHYQCEYPLFRRQDGLYVELQWQLLPRYFSLQIPQELIWSGAGSATVAGAQVPAMSPETLLLVLAIHGAKHLWVRLLWLCDVARLLALSPQLDWKCVQQNARAAGAERLLALGLLLAHDLLGAAVPADLLERARSDRTVACLSGRVRHLLIRQDQDRPWPRQLFLLRMRERWRDRLRYCVRLAATPGAGEWAAVPLPPLLFGLYWLLRPARLAAGLFQRAAGRR